MIQDDRKSLVKKNRLLIVFM